MDLSGDQVDQFAWPVVPPDSHLIAFTGTSAVRNCHTDADGLPIRTLRSRGTSFSPGSLMSQHNHPTPAHRGDARINRLRTLLSAALKPPPGWSRILLAATMGLVCHLVFAAAVTAMIVAMWFGMSRTLGAVAWPYAVLTNALLIVQFPVVHSALLSHRGGKALARLVPGPHGKTLATTSYAIIASAQLLLLFTLWTPSGVILWQAEGSALWLFATAYALSWLLLMKASFDAGAEVQSGALGWMSLLANVRPRFPGMPTLGTFRVIRQPIYVAFTLTLWTTPTWTPDQLMLAVCLSAYCLLAPRLKEARFLARYGTRFETYRRAVPYIIPRLTRRQQQKQLWQSRH